MYKIRNLILWLLLICVWLSKVNAIPSLIPIEKLNIIEAALKKLHGNFNINKVNIEEISDLNLYRIVMQDNLEVLYLSTDGKYFFYGELLDLHKNEKDRNLTEVAKRSIRKLELNNFPKKDMIIFRPEHNLWGLRKPLGILTVFTDLTCHYGNKLHKEAEKALKSGIEIRYIFFPRGGIDSDGYKKAVRVWCSKQRNQAFALATEGKDIESDECRDHPIKEHFEFARKIGIQATPSIVLNDGSLIPGYRPAEELIKLVTDNNKL